MPQYIERPAPPVQFPPASIERPRRWNRARVKELLSALAAAAIVAGLGYWIGVVWFGPHP